MTNPKVSVIVPVYNVAPYLGECLDSLINQTLKDIEIICIDDKSTDNSVEILKEYEKKDDRIKVICSQENSGTGASRSKGLDAANGEYIGFVDSDDWVSLDFYEELYNRAKKEKADVAAAEKVVNYYSKEKQLLVPTNFESKKCIKTIIDKGKGLSTSISVCNKLFSVNFLRKHNLNFPENSYGEDISVGSAGYFLSNKIAVSQKAIYFYRREREGSAATGKKGVDYLFVLIENLKNASIILENSKMNFLSKIAWRYILNTKFDKHIMYAYYQVKDSQRGLFSKDVSINLANSYYVVNLAQRLFIKKNFIFILLTFELLTFRRINKIKYARIKMMEDAWVLKKQIMPLVKNEQTAKTKVSVIVPAYNVAPYLGECLDSLINQTLKDIEIICIDDKSTDNSAEILTEYEKKDSRIKVIYNKENIGTGGARNKGIEAAEGEYIGFVDSDDWVSLDFFEILYNRAKEEKAEISATSNIIAYFNHKKNENVKLGLRHKRKIISVAQKRRVLNATMAYVNKIYSKSFLNKHDLKFQENSYTEEFTLLVPAYFLSKGIAVSDTPIYFYRQERPGSAVTGVKDLSSVFSLLNNIKSCYKILESSNLNNSDKIKWKKVLDSRFFADLMITYNKIKYSERKQYIDAIKSELKMIDFKKAYIKYLFGKKIKIALFLLTNIFALGFTKSIRYEILKIMENTLELKRQIQCFGDIPLSK